MAIRILFLGLLILSVGCAGTSRTAAQPPSEFAEPRPSGAITHVVKVIAQVAAVDAEERVVTLIRPDGSATDVRCGPEVVNFDQIRVGDEVEAEFEESLAITVTPHGEAPSAAAVTDVALAPVGSRPGAAAVRTTQVTATVDAIDYATRRVWLRGPRGNVLSLHAGPGVRRFDAVRVGDTVVARYTEALAIAVRPTEPR